MCRGSRYGQSMSHPEQSLGVKAAREEEGQEKNPEQLGGGASAWKEGVEG